MANQQKEEKNKRIVSKRKGITIRLPLVEEKLDEKFLDAVKKGDLELADYYLKNGADINAKYIGCSALHIAIRNRDKKLSLFLIDKGIDVNSKDPIWRTALHEAVLFDKEIVEKIIDKVDVNAKDKNRETPLHILANRKDDEAIEIAQLLLKKGANTHIKNNKDWDVFVKTIATKNKPLMKEILKENAKQRINKSHKLHYLVEQEAKDIDDNMLLHLAVLWDNYWGVRLILEGGYENNAKDRYGQDATYYCKTREIKEFIIEYRKMHNR